MNLDKSDFFRSAPTLSATSCLVILTCRSSHGDFRATPILAHSFASCAAAHAAWALGTAQRMIRRRPIIAYVRERERARMRLHAVRGGRRMWDGSSAAQAAA